MLSFSLKVTLTLQKFEQKTKIFQFEINVSIKQNQTFSEVLTHFIPMFHFYTPWKRRKTFGFLTFSGGNETEDWAKKK